MSVTWDDLTNSIENRKRRLDAFRASVERLLDALQGLPSDMADVARELLAKEIGLSPTSPMSATTGGTDVQEQQDMVGKPALECVRIILREHNNKPLHFAAIAKEAMRRGYKGRSQGSQEEIESRTANSFWAAMSRSDDLESVGKGLYRAVAANPAHDTQANASASVQRDSWAGRAAVILKKAGRQMTIDEILSELQKLHLNRPITKATVFSGIWRRKDLFILSGREGISLRTPDFLLV